MSFADSSLITEPARKKSKAKDAADMVVTAADGQMFLVGDNNRTQDQHLGKNRISPDQIARWQSIFRRRHQWFSENGIPYNFLIGADKQSVYWESLNLDQPDHRNSLLIFADSLGMPPIIDPVPALRAAVKDGIDVFPKTDSHWDWRGGYIAYSEVMARTNFGKLLVEGSEFMFAGKDLPGDLGMKFNPPVSSVSSRLKPLRLKAQRIYHNAVDRNGSISIFKKVGGKGLGVMVGDSYSQALTPFFAEHFDLFIQLRGSTDLHLLAGLKPSIVIGQLAERFLASRYIVDDDIPVEMLFIERLVRREMKPEKYAKNLLLPTDLSILPPSVNAMIRRQSALGDSLLFSDPRESQASFLGETFPGHAPGDTLTAICLAQRLGRPLHPAWIAAFRALPAHAQGAMQRLGFLQS
jgi:hypothetical protein